MIPAKKSRIEINFCLCTNLISKGDICFLVDGSLSNPIFFLLHTLKTDSDNRQVNCRLHCAELCAAKCMAGALSDAQNLSLKYTGLGYHKFENLIFCTQNSKLSRYRKIKGVRKKHTHKMDKSVCKVKYTTRGKPHILHCDVPEEIYFI